MHNPDNYTSDGRPYTQTEWNGTMMDAQPMEPANLLANDRTAKQMWPDYGPNTLSLVQLLVHLVVVYSILQLRQSPHTRRHVDVDVDEKKIVEAILAISYSNCSM